MLVTFIKVLAWIFLFGSAVQVVRCLYTEYYLTTPMGKLEVTLARVEGKALRARSPKVSALVFVVCLAAIIATWGQ